MRHGCGKVPKGKRKSLNKRLVLLILLALGIRFALMGLNHPFDIQTWNGLTVDLSNNRSPYETLEKLTYESRATQGAGWAMNFQYFNYPPMLIPIYYPFAKLYGAFYPTGQIQYSTANDVTPYTQVPMLLNLLFKLPIFLADIGIALLLYKMTKRSEKSMIAYLFNPFVIFISACWMFDSIAAFFLLLATYLFQNKRYDLSAVALSFGFLTKIFPVFALPVFCIELIRRRSWKFLRYAFIFGLVAALFILPFFSGVKLGLEYQAAREPSGLTPLSIHIVLQNLGISGPDLTQLKFIILPAIASFLLVIGMSLIYAYLSKKSIPLNQKILMVFLAYCVFAKNLHEPHVLMLVPFFILELHERYSFDKKLQYGLLLALPFLYAVVAVPITRFLYGYTMNPAILDLFKLPESVQGILLSGIVIMFCLTLWHALITLIRGRPVISLKGLRQRLKNEKK